MLKQQVDCGGLVIDDPARKQQAPSRIPFRAAGSPDEEAIHVLEGLIALYGVDIAGKRQIVALRFPGETVWPGGRGRFGIWPLVASQLVVTHANDVLGCYADELSPRNQSIAFEWLAQSRAGALERTAHLLCEIAVRGGYGTDKIPNMLTQVQVGDITGQTSVNVNRIFAELEARVLIGRTRGEIIFRDWEGLRRLASFDPAYLEAA